MEVITPLEIFFAVLDQAFAKKELIFTGLQSKTPSYYKEDFKIFNVLRLNWILRFSAYSASILISFLIIVFSKGILNLSVGRLATQYFIKYVSLTPLKCRK